MIQATGQKKASITQCGGVRPVEGIRFPVTPGEFVVVPGSPGTEFCRDPNHEGTTDIVMLIFSPNLLPKLPVSAGRSRGS